MFKDTIPVLLCKLWGFLNSQSKWWKNRLLLEIRPFNLREEKDGLILAKEVGFIPVSISLAFREQPCLVAHPKLCLLIVHGWEQSPLSKEWHEAVAAVKHAHMHGVQVTNEVQQIMQSKQSALQSLFKSKSIYMHWDNIHS